MIIHPVMEWYYSKNGVQLGPVSREDLVQKKQSGEVLPSDLVWKQGMADWIAIAHVAELAGATALTPPSFATVNRPSFTPPIPNYLWQSIVATVLCCMPFGVVAIIFSSKVDGLVAQGDIAGAMAASKSAKTWVGVSVGSFVLFFVLFFLLGIVGSILEG